MDKQIHLYLMDDGKEYMLSLACTDGQHSITLLESIPSKGKGYVTVGKPYYTDDLAKFFEILTDAYDDELSIFTNYYEVEFESSNDNKLVLAVDND